ncbi:YkvA family protein [Chloroflexota bacterium]
MAGIKLWKKKASQLTTEICTLYWCLRDVRVPWYVKVFLVVIVAYALSPIDLIPDFIPVLGYLDDLILLPAGIYLVLRMIPREVLEECRQKVVSEPIAGKSRWVAAAAIILVWMLVLYFIVRFIWIIIVE